ncbi:MAG: arginine--tRNA ligase [Planctomycetota bacterium]
MIRLIAVDLPQPDSLESITNRRFVSRPVSWCPFMHFPSLIRDRLATALGSIAPGNSELADLVRPTNEAKFGDYQCNAAMPLAKRLGESPRDLASKIVETMQWDDLLETPRVEGPGFINLTLRDSVLMEGLTEILESDRLGVSASASPQRIIIDYSSPNVAKPMHVGHIRTTVIGHALTKVLRFLGHDVITDNHLGDWGTQFGIIIYGYKHFGDATKVAANPVPELAALYRLTHALMGYHDAVASLPRLEEAIAEAEQEHLAAKQSLADSEADPELSNKQRKSFHKKVAAAERRWKNALEALEGTREKIANAEKNPDVGPLLKDHQAVSKAVLEETAKLHQGDPENRRLWEEFLPHCKDEINRIYDRLNVSFDHTLGESFYHDQLAGVVDQLKQQGLTTVSDGAICVFVDGFDSPMIVQKSDGAFLYATTDLATLQYRKETFQPDEILYVVDARQAEHFDKLFALATAMGVQDIRLVHVKFGTVLGADGRPMKTRSGSLIGLESLLDDAVESARKVVCNPERLTMLSPPMDEDEQQRVAESVGLGAIKYADLSHHRTSDYRFDVNKMVSLDGNTATYIQYSYARTQGILRKAADNGIPTTVSGVLAKAQDQPLRFYHPHERGLALMLLRFEESLITMRELYAPNVLCDYLYETAKTYSSFNDNCRVLGNEEDAITQTRLALVIATGRVLQCGLQLLGIRVVDRM